MKNLIIYCLLTSLLRLGGCINRLIVQYYCIGYLLWKKVVMESNIMFYGSIPSLTFKKNSDISFGENFILRTGKKYGIDGVQSRIHVAESAVLKIGKNSGMTNTTLYVDEKITIGDYVNIGAGCLIMDSNFHSTDWRDRMDRSIDIKKKKTAPIQIGDVVFIGARSIICKRVSIGNHSMIAAGSVVVTDVPDNQIWGGNPAVFLKYVK